MTVNDTKTVRVTGGLVRGTREEGQICRFLGIPYAAAPAGDMRWKEAQPPIPWEGVKDCTTFGKNAMQAPQKPFFVWTEEFIIQDTGYSEDCLNLNIWTKEDGQENKPVLVYLHGGGFCSGGSSCEIYDGAAMAKRGIVFLSFNHRVGDAGLYTSPELDAESETGTSGSYTLMDEITLLKWVKENIRAFGGDPDNVTLMGQSSGAGEINALGVSPLAKGLFHKAVVMGLNTYRLKGQKCDWLTKVEAQEKADNLMEGRSLKELRQMPAEDLLDIDRRAIEEKRVINPLCELYTDGSVLDVDFNTGVDEGRTNDILWMMGMVTNDAVVTDALTPSPVRCAGQTPETILGLMKDLLGPELPEAIRLYGLDGENIMQGMMDINRDYLMAAMQKIASVRRTTGNADTYVYWLSHIMPGPGSEMAGAFHTSEVPYFLGNLSPRRQEFWAETDRSLAEGLPEALAEFLKTGNPGSGWQPAKDGSYTRIDDAGCQIEAMPEEKYAFWQRVFA